MWITKNSRNRKKQERLFIFKKRGSNPPTDLPFTKHTLIFGLLAPIFKLKRIIKILAKQT